MENFVMICGWFWGQNSKIIKYRLWNARWYVNLKQKLIISKYIYQSKNSHCMWINSID